MPFDRPTIDEIDANQRADIVSRLPGTDPLLRRSYIGALSRSMAGGLHELYGFIQWIARSGFPRHRRGRRTSALGCDLGPHSGSRCKGRGRDSSRGHGGRSRSGEHGVALGRRRGLPIVGRVRHAAAEEGNIDVEAVVAAGGGNAEVGVILGVITPIVGLVSTANVSTALAGGADIESDASLRARLLQRIQNPPRGGTSEDYEFWSLTAHPDVTRAWTRPNTPAIGQVTVYFMTDDATADGVPNAATETTVDDYIQGEAAGDGGRDGLGADGIAAQHRDQQRHANPRKPSWTPSRRSLPT